MGLRVMIKHKKRIKVFIGNFQFNFRAPTKKPVFGHPVSRSHLSQLYPLINKAKKKPNQVSYLVSIHLIFPFFCSMYATDIFL